MAPNEEIQAPGYAAIVLNADQIASEIIEKIVNDAILISNTSKRCMLWTNKIVDFEMSITALKLVDKVINDAINEVTNGKGDAPDDSNILKDKLKKCATVINAIFFDKGDAAGSLEDINQLDYTIETDRFDQIREHMEIIKSDSKEELPAGKSDKIVNNSGGIYSVPLIDDEQPVRDTSQNYKAPLLRNSMKRRSWMRTLLRKPISFSKSESDDDLPIKQQVKPNQEAIEIQEIRLIADDQPIVDNSMKIRSWKRPSYLKMRKQQPTTEEPTPNRAGSILGRYWRNVERFFRGFSWNIK